MQRARETEEPRMSACVRDQGAAATEHTIRMLDIIPLFDAKFSLKFTLYNSKFSK